MFCDGCGAAVQSGQAFCSKCGKQIVGPISLMQPRPGAGARSFAQSVLAGAVSFQHHRRHRSVRRGQYGACAQGGARGRSAGVSDSALERSRDSAAGQGCFRIYRGMGIIAARALGSGRRSRPGVRYIVYQHSVRNGARHLYDVGSAARGIGAGI